MNLLRRRRPALTPAGTAYDALLDAAARSMHTRAGRDECQVYPLPPDAPHAAWRIRAVLVLQGVTVELVPRVTVELADGAVTFEADQVQLAVAP